MAHKKEQTVLFSDIRDFTSLTAKKGDREAFRLVKKFTGLVKEKVREHGGDLVKTYGDGVMTTFSSPVEGQKAAIGMQQSLSEYSETNPGDTITVGVGINHGNTIRDEGDIFGHAVNVAARLGNHAKGGQIIVPESCWKAGKSRSFKYLDLGSREFKGIGEQRIYELLWRKEESRLTTKDDELVLVLTEDSLAVELSKDLNEELARARDEVRREAENSSGFTRFILEKVDGLIENQLSGFLNGLLRERGIGLQHDIEDVEIKLQDGEWKILKDGEEILGLPEEEIEPSKANHFIRRLKDLKGQ
ncbi:MAG: adenylate/guanylate cyclase domain-containing protein [Candidatus Acetothermia bacterium]